MVRALEDVQERLQCLHLIYVREGPKVNTTELLGAQPELLWHFTFCLLQSCWRWQIKFWSAFQSLPFALDIWCSWRTARVFPRARCFYLTNQPRDTAWLVLHHSLDLLIWLRYCLSRNHVVLPRCELALCCFLLLPLWKIYESSSERTCATASAPSSRSCPACTLPSLQDLQFR